MKLSLIALLLFTTGLFASEINSQSARVTISMKNVDAGQVIDEIEAQTDYLFLYNWEEVNLKSNVSVNAKNQTVAEVLTGLFRNTDIVYAVEGTSIFLMKKDAIPSSLPGQQQQRTVTGTVLDEQGEAVLGANVAEKGTANGVITDMNGKFTITVGTNAVLQITYVGFITQEITVGNQRDIRIILLEDIHALDELVVIGYGTQRRGNLTGSVSTVQSAELTTSPIASASNALGGRLPGLIATQPGGQPGNDAATLSIRGFGNALIIVDGVETSFNNIDANQIESVSILKDGSASIYGARAGNGVILITTKRGNMGKPTITVNAGITFQGITSMTKPANAGQYTEMKAEEWLQAGNPADQVPFTAEQIKKYYEGTDPAYPNTDWFNLLVRNWAPQQQYNLSVRGGSDKIKYYGFFGYLDQESMWKKNGGRYRRYNFQANTDMKILDNLTMQLTISSAVENGDFPERTQEAGSGGVWSDLWNTLPIYPSGFPDPTKIPYAFGGGVGGVHVTSNSEINGYNNSDKQNLNATATFKYDSKYIKGLSAKVFANYIQYYNTSKRFLKPVDLYTYDPSSDVYTLVGSYNTKAQLTVDDWKGRTLTGQFSLNYDNTFARKHHVSALALYEVIDYSEEWLNAKRIDFLTSSIDQMFAGSTEGMTNDGSRSEMGRVSFVGRINYDYMGKYLIETILRADASAKFPPGKRWGYFPSVSLGWRLSEEGFMKSLTFLDNLKIRGSYGESGNDGVGNFQYLSGYNINQTYMFGSSVSQGIISAGLANPNLTWEKVKIFNAGLDFSVFKRNLYGELDVFYRKREGIPATRITTLPNTFGASLPPENINSLNNRGFELMLGTSNKIGELAYNVSGNISWSRSKWDHYEEPVYEDPDQERLYKNSGRWTDRQIGYISDKLFTSQEEIDNLPFDQDQQGNVSLRPGDIRYVDLNNDGTLDWKDQTEIGKGTVPNWMLGFNINMEYKGFDLSALFQGAFGYYKYIQLYSEIIPAAVLYDLRWTESNNDANASYPRLGGASTNRYASDYYYKKAGYLRLKTMSFGYTFPQKWVSPARIEKLRIYFAGVNLFTIDRLKKYDIDPESPSSLAGMYYPQQRTFTFGVNVSF